MTAADLFSHSATVDAAAADTEAPPRHARPALGIRYLSSPYKCLLLDYLYKYLNSLCDSHNCVWAEKSSLAVMMGHLCQIFP